jgi:hypothetical protein
MSKNEIKDDQSIATKTNINNNASIHTKTNINNNEVSEKKLLEEG